MSDALGKAGFWVVRLLPHLMVLTGLLAIWEWLVAAGFITSILIPRPSAIIASIFRLYVTEGSIYEHFFITLAEAVFGFLIGAGVAIALAVSSSLSESFARYVTPYAVVLNVTPGIALTPIIIAWFGYGMGSKIALAAVLCFFPIFVNTLTGLRQTDPDREELFRSFGATQRQVFTTALIGAVVAEFAQATAGVGVLMARSSFSLDMASSLAALLSMTLIGLILFYSMALLDDRIVFWRRDARMSAVSRARARAWADGTGK